MAQVTIRINGYAYTVGCEDGQEEHLARMAAEIEQRINSIKAIGGQSGEARLLMLASLLLADELFDLKTNGASSAAAQAPEPAPVKADIERRARLRRVAARAEEIASDLLDI
ncbi:MAG TPA: cell division protein ZapA [Acidocella sp.]|nr:cell division protein ZapA [Acidocella sp.]